MEKNVELTVDEINEVAQECSFKNPNQEQIKFILANYNEQADIDPIGYWRLWVEQLLYDAEVDKIKKD